MSASCFSSVRIAAYAGGSDMAPHLHDEDSVGLPLAGRYVERTRGRETEHHLGDILFCPRGEPHSQHFAARTTKLLLTPTAEARAYLADHLILADAPFRRAEILIPAALRLARELRDPDPHSRLIAAGLGYEILGFFARGREERAAPARWLAAARDYVQASACRPLSLAAVARHVERTPGQLSRGYRQMFGCSVGEDARAARLRVAARLLAGGRQPIAEIALECGYFDQAHFTRVFKAAYGVTPGAYRAAAN